MYGLCQTGKSCFVNDICKNEFLSDYYSTDTMKQSSITMEVCKQQISVNFFDVGGESFSNSTATVGTYAANGTIHVFMVPDRDSLNFFINYVNQIHYENASRDVIVCLINKTDLPKNEEDNNLKDDLTRQCDELNLAKKSCIFEISLKDVEATKKIMNDILKDTVIYTGIIGPTCKFKTFHNYIDYTINELNILETYKEKNIMDLSSFKKKIESSIQSFKMNLDSFGRSSKEYTTDNYNQVNKKMNELFRKCNDKIEDVKIKHDEKILNIQNKVNDIESKFINELDGVKERISALEKDMNNQIKFYFNLKDEVSQLKENMVVKKSKRNSLKNNDINNVINKSKVKKRSIIIKNDTMEEIKNNSMDQIDNLTQYNNENNMSSFINKSLNKLESSEEDIKEIIENKTIFLSLKIKKRPNVFESKLLNYFFRNLYRKKSCYEI